MISAQTDADIAANNANPVNIANAAISADAAFIAIAELDALVIQLAAATAAATAAAMGVALV